jgi:membrane fusion protein (multidrug efflux system)
MSRLTTLLPLTLVLALTLAGCSGNAAPKDAVAQKAESKEGQPVETARVVQGDLTSRYAATATLQAEHEAKLISEVPGTVMQLLVEEGDQVKQGQLLARIDAAHSRLQLREAEADLQRRQNDVERGEKLVARKLIAANTQDQTQADFAVRRAEVNMARVVVDKSEIRAPFKGVITRRWIKQGQLLAANSAVFDMSDFVDLRAELRVPERDAVAIAAGQIVNFTVDALGGRHFEAKVDRVAPIVDRESGTVKVTVKVDNHDRSLRPGLFTRMDIAFQHVANALLMPKAAVLGNRGAEVTFVIEDGKAHRRSIRTGYDSGSNVQILEGLDPGAVVVVTGHAALSEGDVVEVLKNDADARVAQNRAVAKADNSKIEKNGG